MSFLHPLELLTSFSASLLCSTSHHDKFLPAFFPRDSLLSFCKSPSVLIHHARASRDKSMNNMLVMRSLGSSGIWEGSQKRWGRRVCGLWQRWQHTGTPRSHNIYPILEGGGSHGGGWESSLACLGERRLETINHFMLIYFMILVGWGLHKLNNMWIR